ncbi:hypothetical protein BDZ45DRAFT_737122 [Acephala macrosclerotiorum]|nr:hypothetical protein BDZ45DRAFT_737122 [Acephala macrosclerotiorum]
MLNLHFAVNVICSSSFAISHKAPSAYPLINDIAAPPDPFLTTTLLHQNGIRFIPEIEKDCTTFSHLHPSPIPTKAEQETTDDLLSVALDVGNSNDFKIYTASPKLIFYYPETTYNGRFKWRMLFVFTRFAGKKEFYLKGFEAQAKTFLSL